MLAYSQFWECHSVQRLLLQLVRIAEGKEYDPRLLIDNRPNTANTLEFLISRQKQLGLVLSEFLEGVYSNQIRNAFAHSQFCVLGEYISWFNYDSEKTNQVPSLKLETWDELFRLTAEFIAALFSARIALEKEIVSKMPYRVDLPEFARPLNLAKDKRGHWST